MPKYLFEVRYTGEGLAGVMKDGGSTRRSIAADLAKSVGGSLESFHFAFGEVDAYLICDLPDNQAAARVALTVSATGRVALRTVPLLTIDEVDSITLGANKLSYTAPGT